MHTFQPYPVDLIEFDPFTKIGTEWMAVTVSDGEKTNYILDAVLILTTDCIEVN